MNAKALVVLLVALLAATGWFLFSQGAPDAAPQGHLPGSAVGGDAAKAKEHADAEAVKLAADAAKAPAPSNERVVAATPMPVAAAKTYTVSGRLVDLHSAPRAGVTLAARTWKAIDGFDIEGMPMMPGPDGKETSTTATSANDGTFRFEFDNDRSGALSIKDDALVFAAEPPHFVGGKGNLDLGDITVLRDSMLRGVVHDQNGQPVADVKVAATIGLIGTTSEDKTKADGTFAVGKLRPGKWALRTLSSKFLPTVEEFTLAAEEQHDGIVLVVKPGNAIAGQVVDDRGVGVADMKVASKRKESHGGVDVERFTADEATVTDSNGYFTLAGLADEATTIRAFGPGHTTATLADVAVGTGNILLRVERYGIVEGVLQGPEGTPIAGSRVSARVMMQGPGGMPMQDGPDFDLISGPSGPTLTAADGTFRLSAVRPGTVVVSATGDGHRPARQPGVRVLPGQVVKGIRLVADPGAVAHVQVKSEDGKPVEDATVTVRKPRAGGAPSNGMFLARRVEIDDTNGDVAIGGMDEDVGSAKTDHDGVAMVRGLPAGDFEIVATHKELAPAPAVAVTVPRVGTVEATLNMRQPGQVQFVVTDSDGGFVSAADLVITQNAPGAEDSPIKARTDEHGTTLVKGLTPGDYSASLARAAQGTQIGDMAFVGAGDSSTIASSASNFTVYAGRTVMVQLHKPILTTIRGVMTGSDGVVAGALVSLEGEQNGGFDLPGFSSGRSATTAADGSYAIEDVEAGSYVLRYGKREQLIKATHTIEVPPNTKDLRQDLALLTGTLRLQVVAKDGGDPVGGADVELQRSDDTAEGKPKPREHRMMMVSMLTTDGGGGGGETTMTVGAQRERTDDDGVAVIKDVPVGTYTVNIHHKRYAPGELKGQVVVERQQTDCGRVGLDGAGTIRGKVVGSDGKTVHMATVQSRPLGSKDEDGQPEMAMGGSFRINGLSAGKYEVRAQAIGEELMPYSPWREVEVKVGETTVADITLPPK